MEANRKFRFRIFQKWNKLLFNPEIIFLAITYKHIKVEGFLSFNWFLDEPIVVVLDVPTLSVGNTDDNDDDEATNDRANDEGLIF